MTDLAKNNVLKHFNATLSVKFDVFTVNTAQFHVGVPFFQFREYTPAPLCYGQLCQDPNAVADGFQEKPLLRVTSVV